MIRQCHRFVAVVFGLAVGGQAFVGTAAARGTESSGDPLAIAIVGGLAISAGLLGWLIAVTQDTEWQRQTLAWLKVSVGPLLVALGLAAMGSAASRQPGIAGVGGGLGTVVVWGVLSDGDGPAASDHTVFGAAAVHRAVEGLTLAAAYVAGSVVALLGALVLAGHVTAGTATLSGVWGVGRLRATGVVLVVQAVFVLGAMATLAVVGGVPELLRIAALAFVGGTLLVVGLVEANLRYARGRPAGPDRS